MKRFLVLGTGLLLLAGTGAALAQMPPGGGGPGGPGGGPGGPEGMGHYGMMEHGFRHHPPPPGASFRLRRGDAEIDIRCSVRETSKDCVDSALRLMDKVAGGPGTTPAPATPQ